MVLLSQLSAAAAVALSALPGAAAPIGFLPVLENGVCYGLCGHYGGIGLTGRAEAPDWGNSVQPADPATGHPLGGDHVGPCGDAWLTDFDVPVTQSCCHTPDVTAISTGEVACICPMAITCAGMTETPAGAGGCPEDVNGDSSVDVNDLLQVLSAYGDTGVGGEDTNGDNIVDVNDLLAVLSAFGATCAAAPAPTPTPPAPTPPAQTIEVGGTQGWVVKPQNALYDNIIANVGDTISFSYSSYYHDVMLVDNENCDFSSGTLVDDTGSFQWVIPAPGSYTFVCTRGDHCGTGNQQVTVTVAGGGGAPAPPPPAPAPCAMGSDCGGQVWNDCGTSCPAVCGTPPPMMCNMMCNAAYQCPNGLQWDAVGMACSSNCAGGGGGDTLPPGVAPGRPFLSAKTVPVFAEAVEQAVSDWMGMVGPDGKHNHDGRHGGDYGQEEEF